MAYEKSFSNPYPDGWEDLPSEKTPITAAALQEHTNAIEHIEDYLSEGGGGGTKVAYGDEEAFNTWAETAQDGDVFARTDDNDGSSTALEFNVNQTPTDVLENIKVGTKVYGALDERKMGAPISIIDYKTIDNPYQTECDGYAICSTNNVIHILDHTEETSYSFPSGSFIPKGLKLFVTGSGTIANFLPMEYRQKGV